MDKFIIERRARIRLGWFKRDEKIGNISQVYLRTYQAPEHKTSLCVIGSKGRCQRSSEDKRR
jgi:hypothetical protein